MDKKNENTTTDPLLEEKQNRGDHESPSTKIKEETEKDSEKMLKAIKQTGNKVCSRKFLSNRLPFLRWIIGYNLEMLMCDTIAGVTTALTVIPQGIGYAPLAGLPLQYGLYGSIVPGFVYCLLGTTRQITVGPTAVNYLMSYNYAGGTPYKAVTLAFWSGLIEILAGFFNMGFLIQFISAPVLSAFTNVVSIKVVTACVKGFFGLTFHGRGFITIWRGLFENILTVNVFDMTVAISCMIILFCLRKLKEQNWCEGKDGSSMRARVFKKSKWLLSISANCLVTVTLSIIAWMLLDIFNIDVLTLTGKVDSGLPAWQLPWEFNRNASAALNLTETFYEGPFELAEEFGLGLVMIPLVSILQHLAIAKHYAGNKRMAASQEMIALGFCQFVGSFTGSPAVTASFGRSAVNNLSGVRTPFGGIITGTIIILTIAFLCPYMAYIPTSALSAVIVNSMIFTIELSTPVKLWKGNKSDLVPYTLAFIIGLLVSVEMGLIVGTLVHMAILVYTTSSPDIKFQETSTHLIVEFKSDLYFPAKDFIIREINHKLTELDTPKILVLDMTQVKSTDYSVAVGLSGVLKAHKNKSGSVAICCSSNSVIGVLNSVHDEKEPLNVLSTLDQALLETNC